MLQQRRIGMIQYNNSKLMEEVKGQQKIAVLESESQNGSDKTKDTLFQVQTSSVFKFIQQELAKTATSLNQLHRKIVTICDGTSASDKIVRLTSAVIKFIKNFQITTWLERFDKFSSQITQLRRLLRVNRILAVIKDYVGFAKKMNKKSRDFFDVFFKTVMLMCDINDLLAYLMQLKVIKERGLAKLKKNVANIYFFECVLWCCLHIYDYYTKDKTQDELKVRRINILKYLMDTAISHNDFSLKSFTIGAKESTLLGLTSSVIGLALIWK